MNHFTSLAKEKQKKQFLSFFCFSFAKLVEHGMPTSLAKEKQKQKQKLLAENGMMPERV